MKVFTVAFILLIVVLASCTSQEQAQSISDNLIAYKVEQSPVTKICYEILIRITPGHQKYVAANPVDCKFLEQGK